MPRPNNVARNSSSDCVTVVPLVAVGLPAAELPVAVDRPAALAVVAAVLLPLEVAVALPLEVVAARPLADAAVVERLAAAVAVASARRTWRIMGLSR